MAPVHSVLALWPGASAAPVQTVTSAAAVQGREPIAGRLVGAVFVHTPLVNLILPVAPLLSVLHWRQVSVGRLVTRTRGLRAAVVSALLFSMVGTGVQAAESGIHGTAICSGCPRLVFGGPRFVPPDTGTSLLHGQPDPLLTEHGAAAAQGDRPSDDRPPGSSAEVPASSSDTFPHARHRRLACLTCHDLRAKERLTFEVPRGCQTCHHQRPARSNCATCHRTEDLAEPRPVSVRVAVPRHQPRLRDVAFDHGMHETLECTGCHSMPVSLVPADSVRTCASCHGEHHAEGRACASCHRTDAIVPAHQPPVQAHQACAACHTAATVAGLVPARSFCLVCHADDVDHFAPKECTTCHFQSTPAELQPGLRRTGGPS